MGKKFGGAILLQLAGAVFWFLYSAFIARVLEPSAFGAVIYAVTVITLLGNIAAAGWSQAVLRSGSRFWSVGNINSFRFLTRQGLLSCMRLTAVISVGLLIGWLVQLPNTIFQRQGVTLMVCLGALAYALLIFAANAMRAKGMLLVSLSLQGFMRSLLPLALSAIFATIFAPSVASILSIFVLSLWCLSFAALMFLPGPLIRKKPTVSTAEEAENNTVARGLFGANLGRIAMENMDVLVIGFVLTPIEVGLYMVAHRIAATIGIIYSSARTMSAPKISIAYATSEHDGLKAAASRANFLFLFGGVGMCLGVLIFAEPLIQVFGSAFQAAYPLLLLRLFAQLTFAFSGPTGVFMTMTNHVKARTIIVWSVTVLTAFTTALGVIALGPLGASLGFALSMLISNAVGAFWVWKLLGIAPAIFDRGAYTILRNGLSRRGR